MKALLFPSWKWNVKSRVHGEVMLFSDMDCPRELYNNQFGRRNSGKEHWYLLGAAAGKVGPVLLLSE